MRQRSGGPQPPSLLHTRAGRKSVAERLSRVSAGNSLCPRFLATGLSGRSQAKAAGAPSYHAETDYAETLRRFADKKQQAIACGIVFDPVAYQELVYQLAAETKHVDIETNAVFIDAVTASGGKAIDRIEVSTPSGRKELKAAYYIDATADIQIAVSAGCRVDIGEDPAVRYNESSAPEVPRLRLNGWTLLFMVAPDGQIQGESDPHAAKHPWAHICEMPGGELNVNPCLMLTGEEGFRLGEARAMEVLLGRLHAYWQDIRSAYSLEGYGIKRIFPRIGVREGHRLRARYMLTENDFLAGNYGRHHEDCVAFCDHALDVHAPGGGCREVPNGPFGIPFRCLQPEDLDNLLVVSRGAGFSHLAASAARLQRTLMSLGEAAARFVENGKIVKPVLPPYSG